MDMTTTYASAYSPGRYTTLSYAKQNQERASLYVSKHDRHQQRSFMQYDLRGVVIEHTYSVNTEHNTGFDGLPLRTPTLTGVARQGVS